MPIFTEWIFFALMAAGLFMLRKRLDYRPVYRVWGFPWVPGIFILSSVVIVINRMIAQPLDSLAGLAMVGAGIPVYYSWVRPAHRAAELDVHSELDARTAAHHDQYDASYN